MLKSKINDLTSKLEKQDLALSYSNLKEVLNLFEYQNEFIDDLKTQITTKVAKIQKCLALQIKQNLNTIQLNNFIELLEELYLSND